MTADQTTKQSVLKGLDEDAVASTLADLVNIPSSTGHELQAASYIHDRMRSIGVESRLQQFDEDRANVIATLKGSGGGPAVMLNGHLDTSYTGYEPELKGKGYKNEAVVEGDWMYGNGVHNMKNALASYVEIFEAIVRAGVTLPGDVILAGVAGEIERAPYAQYQGPEYEGFGRGTNYALAHGLDADVCILGEPSANTIGVSNLGVNWVRLSVTGTMAHTQHAETAVNAIYQMQKVMDRLRPWMAEYRERHALDGIKPACDITAINGGWPYRVSRTPVFCDVFLCIRTTPGMRTTTVRRELGEFLRGLREEDPSLDVEVEFYVSHQPTEISPDEPLVQILASNHEAVLGSPPEFHRRTAYMDSSSLNAHGIPTVVYGASGRLNTPSEGRGWAPHQGEHTYLPDLVDSTRVVASTVVELTSSTDPRLLKG